MNILMIIIYAIISVSGLTLFKLGAANTLSLTLSGGKFSFEASWLSLLGLALYVVSFLMYMGIISKNQLSYVAPLSTGIVYVLTLAASMLVFKESLSVFQAIGCGLILVGILLMNLPK